MILETFFYEVWEIYNVAKVYGLERNAQHIHADKFWEEALLIYFHVIENVARNVRFLIQTLQQYSKKYQHKVILVAKYNCHLNIFTYKR